MFSIDSTIVAVALPTMTSDLHTNLVWIGWTLTAYQLTQTIVLPLAGKLAESFGRARIFLVCVLLFTLGSVLCGIAQIGAGVHDHRRFATELERHRGEVVGGRLHHLLADGRRAGEEDVIPLLVEQRGGVVDAAFDDRDRGVVDVARHEPRDRR